MKYKNIKNFLILSAALVLISTGCKKPGEVAELGEAGTTIVKFYNGGDLAVVPMALTPTVETIEIGNIRRDAAGASKLNESLKVSFTNSQTLLDEYNDDNGTEYEFLPTNAYTIAASSGVAVSGNVWTITLNPGEFARTLSITLDKSKLDLSKAYAFAFTLTDVGSAKASADQGLILINPIVKNQYHGVYHSVGVFHHPTAGDRPIDEDKELITSGPNSVTAPLGDLGTAGYKVKITVNADNTLTLSPAGVTPNIDQHWGANYYDPATKSFHLHYSYNTAAPRVMEEVITLK